MVLQVYRKTKWVYIDDYLIDINHNWQNESPIKPTTYVHTGFLFLVTTTKNEKFDIHPTRAFQFHADANSLLIKTRLCSPSVTNKITEGF